LCEADGCRIVAHQPVTGRSWSRRRLVFNICLVFMTVFSVFCFVSVPHPMYKKEGVWCPYLPSMQKKIKAALPEANFIYI
jgi:hypothetical protein